MQTYLVELKCNMIIHPELYLVLAHDPAEALILVEQQAKFVGHTSKCIIDTFINSDDLNSVAPQAFRVHRE